MTTSITCRHVLLLICTVSSSEHKDMPSRGRLKDCVRISSCALDGNVSLPFCYTIKNVPAPKGARTPLSIRTWGETPLALAKSEGYVYSSLRELSNSSREVIHESWLRVVSSQPTGTPAS